LGGSWGGKGADEENESSREGEWQTKKEQKKKKKRDEMGGKAGGIS